MCCLFSSDLHIPQEAFIAIGFTLQVNRPKDTFLRTATTTASTARQRGQEFYMEQRESTMEEENMVTSTRKKIPGCEKTPG